MQEDNSSLLDAVGVFVTLHDAGDNSLGGRRCLATPVHAVNCPVAHAVSEALRELLGGRVEGTIAIGRSQQLDGRVALDAALNLLFDRCLVEQ